MAREGPYEIVMSPVHERTGREKEKRRGKNPEVELS